MQKIILATGNAGKKKEILSFFPKDCGIKFLDLKDFDDIPEPIENGKTFEENALIKAQYYAEKFNLPAFADDSGYVVDAFPEKFGVRTKREIEAKDDIIWLEKFLEMMSETENKKAKFSCAIAYFDPSENISKAFLGETSGVIVDFPQAPIEKGIPASSVFIPDGKDEVYSALSAQEKNKISHRGKAITLFWDWFQKK